MKKFIIIMSVIMGIIGSTTMFLYTLEYYMFDYTTYYDEFIRLNIDSKIDMEASDLEVVTYEMVNYLKSNGGSVDLSIFYQGQEQKVFSPKEQTHLHDIQILISNGEKLLLGFNVFLVIGGIILIFASLQRKNLRATTARVLKTIWITSCLIIGFMTMSYFIDFNGAFIKFHEIFFTNDLWILNPKTDVLMMMMPLEFFMTFVKKWLTLFVGLNITVFISWLVIRLKKTEKERDGYDKMFNW